MQALQNLIIQLVNQTYRWMKEWSVHECHVSIYSRVIYSDSEISGIQNQ